MSSAAATDCPIFPVLSLASSVISSAPLSSSARLRHSLPAAP
jgi:hypothetical protein